MVPIEASTRPQFGSLPNTAALNRLLRAMLRPTSTASSSEAAPCTVMAISWSAPSASASSCMARSVQARVTASVRSGSDGVMPEAPLASRATVSLVDMQPSESSRSKVTRVAARRAWSRSPAVGDGVGGEDDEHGGQLRREHAGALGHPADRPAGALDDDLLADRVGGHDRVRGVVAARRRPGRRTPRRRRPAPARAGWPGRSARWSRRGRRSRRCRARSATRSATAWVVWKPSGPV